MDFDACAGFLEGGPEDRVKFVHAHQDVLGGRYAAAVAEVGAGGLTLDEMPGLDGADGSGAAEPLGGSAASAEEEAMLRQRRALLAEVIPLALGDLETQDRMLLKLRFVDGAKQRHIAGLQGVHESRVS